MVVNLGGRNCTVVQLASKGTNINFLFQLKDEMRIIKELIVLKHFPYFFC